MKDVQPVIVVSPLMWLLITFWKPVAVFLVALSILIPLTFPVIAGMAHDSAMRHAAEVTTVPIPAVWAQSLTQAAVLTPTVSYP
jgi:hypothetical protein